MTDAETFFPAPRIVHVGGADITFTPIRFARLAAFHQAAQAPGPWLFLGEDMTALTQHPDDMRRLIAVAADPPLDPAFLDTLSLAEMLALSVAVREVNLDFFDAMAAAGISIPMKLKATGLWPTPLSDLPETASDTVTPLN